MSQKMISSDVWRRMIQIEILSPDVHAVAQCWSARDHFDRVKSSKDKSEVVADPAPERSQLLLRGGAARGRQIFQGQQQNVILDEGRTPAYNGRTIQQN